MVDFAGGLEAIDTDFPRAMERSGIEVLRGLRVINLGNQRIRAAAILLACEGRSQVLCRPVQPCETVFAHLCAPTTKRGVGASVGLPARSASHHFESIHRG